MSAQIKGLVAMLLLAVPFQVYADDATIAKQLSKDLQSAKETGDIQHFRINVKVEDGTVWMKGRVASDEHRDLALDKARRVEGVRLVVNDIEVSPVAQASALEPVATARPLAPVTNGAVRNQAAARVANARRASQVGSGVRAGGRQVDYSTVIGNAVGEYNHQVISEGVVGGYVNEGVVSYGGGNPVPVGGGHGGSYTGQTVYENAQMPNYAWPSYAAHPNYAGIQYPRQYSPTAWPYIGPFYPYPQVPLGWRKVALEWDDGWWQLDFTHK